MKYGYARVSTKDQVLNLQMDALQTAGCHKIFYEVAKGARADRPEWLKLLEEIQKGDTLIVWKLDRMGRSLHHLIKVVNDLIAKGVDIISIQDPLNTTSAQGRLIFNMFASFAEFERELISERTRAGIAAMKKRNPGGGRVRGLSKDNIVKVTLAKNLSQKGEMKPADIYKSLGISKATYYRYLLMNKST